MYVCTMHHVEDLEAKPGAKLLLDTQNQQSHLELLALDQGRCQAALELSLATHFLSLLRHHFQSFSLSL